MKYIALLFFLVVLTVTTPAVAKDFEFHTVRYRLPVIGNTAIDGVDHKCLDVPQWQQVMVIARQYGGLYDWRLEMQGVIAAHQLVVKGYELMIQDYQRLIDNRDTMIKYWKGRVGDLEKQLTLNLFKNKVETYILWAIVAVESVLMIGLGVYSYVEVYRGSELEP